MQTNYNYQKNALALEAEFEWFQKVMTIRMQTHFGQEVEHDSIDKIPIPDLSQYPSPYSDIVIHFGFQPWERLVILLALAPHIAPHILDAFFTNNPKTNRAYTQFGGLKGVGHTGFLPTLQTALFVVGDVSLRKRFLASNLFDEESLLRTSHILQLKQPTKGEPKMSAGLHISEEYLSYFTSGKNYKPDFSSNFPASLIKTKMEWEDLVLEPFTRREVMEIPAWLKHEHTILHEWGMDKQIKPGYRALFYGPPGTGKTLTASLIGKTLGVDVYRIDISRVVSKYIGETEKNMANIFDQAENKNWILFFDEADALFGKRTATHDSKDRHANQEVAYLLQRVESFPGVVILASNFKHNIDEAFARRFQTMIHFPMPNANQRLKLWKNALPKQAPLKEDVRLFDIAQKYKLAGGSIINVVRHCAITALQRGDLRIGKDDILYGIKREFGKEGRTL